MEWTPPVHSSYPMKSFLKSLRSAYIFYRQCYLDARRFRDSISARKLGTQAAVARIESDVVRQYHVIEKGLTMPDFRPGFGKDMVRGLVRSMRALEKHPCSALCNNGQIAAARATLREYHERHAALGHDISDVLPDTCRDLWQNAVEGDGGSRAFEPVAPGDSDAFERVVRSRSSVRNFDPERIPSRDVIMAAVDLALRSPSVCNRQTARVHVFTGADAQRALSFQSGNRGFGHRIPMVIIVTSDLRYFTGTAERYQGWIDGGMFAMLLLLALHAKGLGAVALNWSVLNQRDGELRKAMNLPDHERVIMLVGCGHPSPDALVPVSSRRLATDVASWAD
jgi:nitroreductase